MSRLPTTIRVGAFDFKITAWGKGDAHAAARFGQFNATVQRIWVDEACGPVKALDTLLHEINHAIYWAYGISPDDDEERTVGAMSSAWTQIYRDNPDVLRFIRESVDAQRM